MPFAQNLWRVVCCCVAVSVREGGVVRVVVDYCVVCGMGNRVDDPKWELVPVLITKNRLLESIGGLYKKGSSESKKDQVNLYKL